MSSSSCYQLNVACDLSDRCLLINDFAGALPVAICLQFRALALTV